MSVAEKFARSKYSNQSHTKRIASPATCEKRPLNRGRVAACVFLGACVLAGVQTVQHSVSPTPDRPLVRHAESPTEIAHMHLYDARDAMASHAGSLLAPSPAGASGVFRRVREDFLLYQSANQDPAGLDAAACKADAVVIGSVASATPMLTAHESFLFTDYKLFVERVPRDNNRKHIITGNQITITASGGRGVLPDGRVIDVLDSVAPLTLGNHYFIILKFLGQTGDYAPFSRESIFDISDGQVNATPHFEEGTIGPMPVQSLIAALGAQATCASGGRQ